MPINPIKHKFDDNVVIWNKQEFNISSDTVEIFMCFRIITGIKLNRIMYIRKILPSISMFNKHGRLNLKKNTSLTITGDKVHGYQACIKSIA